MFQISKYFFALIIPIYYILLKLVIKIYGGPYAIQYFYNIYDTILIILGFSSLVMILATKRKKLNLNYKAISFVLMANIGLLYSYHGMYFGTFAREHVILGFLTLSGVIFGILSFKNSNTKQVSTYPTLPLALLNLIPILLFVESYIVNDLYFRSTDVGFYGVMVLSFSGLTWLNIHFTKGSKIPILLLVILIFGVAIFRFLTSL